MEIFYTFIECSISVLAFSAIVAEFRKRTKANWNIRLYQGILSHTIQAFVYSCLPLLLKEFVENEQILWSICGITLGTITLLQGFVILLTDKLSTIKIKIWIIFVCLLILILQLSFVFGFHDKGLGVYAIGIFWHLFQSLFIIASFLVNPQADEN